MRILKRVIIFCLLLLPMLGCKIDTTTSLKDISAPYTGQYYCEEARWGEDNLLEKYDEITLILVDKQNMQFIFKPKDGKKNIIEGNYTFDSNTNTLSGTIAILGMPTSGSVILENGQFCIVKNLFGKTLYMKFSK